jgi:hypothetical protein
MEPQLGVCVNGGYTIALNSAKYTVTQAICVECKEVCKISDPPSTLAQKQIDDYAKLHKK